MKEYNIEKDKENTKKRLLNALGNIIDRNGFDKIGVNAVANEAKVSKVLIYRYFGSLDNMVIDYLSENRFWDNFSINLPKDENLKEFLKSIFHKQIAQLKQNTQIAKIYKWELLEQNTVIEKFRLKREARNMTLITLMSQLTNHPQDKLAALATIINSSITYLILLSQNCPIYNGIDLQDEKGWKQISEGIDLLIDAWFDSTKK